MVNFHGSRADSGHGAFIWVSERLGVQGTGVRTSPGLATLANGTMVHALDFDETNHPTSGKAGGWVITQFCI